MCGIIGVTGAAEPLALLLDGLAALEYRGYDSAGVAAVDAKTGRLWRVRAADRTESVERLGSLLDGAPEAIAAGIGHTRWATHGAPSEPNAHPHVDCSGRIALVHNGIIENHRELAAELDAAGHRRTSQTDTEVLVHLIESELASAANADGAANGDGAANADGAANGDGVANGEGSLLEAVRHAVARASGDFAIAVVHQRGARGDRRRAAYLAVDHRSRRGPRRGRL